MSISSIRIAILFLAVTANLGFAGQAPTWTSGGPHGGDVLALAIDPATPGTIYAGTDGGGIFKSTDTGATWVAINSGLTNPFVRALAIDPVTPATLYAGTVAGGGVFKSINGGGTWAPINTGLTSLSVNALAINPATPATLYAGTDNGLFRSADAGGTWTAVNTGLTNLFVYAVAIDPVTPATVYAGTNGGGVFKSANSGGAWAAVNTGLSDLFVYTLAINPTSPTTIYAGTDNGPFKSSNAGTNWAAATSGLSGLVVTVLAINRTAPDTLYVATNTGLFKSINAAATWSAANTGLTGQTVQALAINPTTPATLYAGANFGGGVFKSTDAGGAWTAANTGVTGLTVRALSVNPATPATVYAGTVLGTAGVFKSVNSGGGWTAANSGLTSTLVVALAVDPVTPATLYAGTNGLGLFKSTNAGGTWSDSSTGLSSFVTALAIDPVTPATIYAGTNGDGVYKSVNGGAGWVAMNSGLSSLTVYALAIDPGTTTTLYAGTDAGVFKSINAGGTWAAVNTGLTSAPPVFALAINPATPATLYAGTETGGVFRSTNAGASWAAANGVAPTNLTNLFVAALAVNPATPTTVHAGTLGGGIFTSTDSGTTWTANNTGQTNPRVRVNALALDPTGATLYAGLESGSVWRLSSTTTTVAPAITTHPASQAVAPGGTASFSAAASGSPAPTVRWQVSTNSGGTWSDISGATSTTYSFAAAQADSGKQYRAVFTNSAGSASTNAATLTVSTTAAAPTVTTHPSNQSVMAGATATFSASASGSPSPTVQWQVSTNSGGTWSDVSGATSTSYAFATAAADNGKQFRAVFTNSAGSATSNAASLTVSTTTPVAPTMALDKTGLVFAAVSTGTAFTAQTPAQTIRLLQSGAGAVTWTATSSAPWLVVSPASGSGPATLMISAQFVSGLAASQSGTITLAFTGASNTAGSINVTLTTVPTTAPASLPFGSFDTPAGDATVLSGSIAVTGWTLDNIGVQRVELWRDLQAGETTPPFASTPTDPRHGKVFIANATFVDGARPDVEGLYPTVAANHRGGWGYLLLTWGLWNQGNGTYQLHAFALDQENNLTTIGSKTIVVNNSAATKPFGAIDTPGVGGDASGPNFGWALTPKVNGVATCKIQPSGVQVSIDSGPLQPVVYGDARSDIAGAFPGFSNTAGAGGHFIVDWSTLTNGLHTIGWLITDDCNRADGVGSRFFNVSTGGNLTAAMTAGALAAAQTESVEAITVARGFGELPEIVTGEAGSRTIEVRQGERIEIRVPRGFESAYELASGGQRRPLPSGATWDAASGTFYWQPAPAFLGRYRIVFTNGSERISVRVMVRP